jgi:hypothetical protein
MPINTGVSGRKVKSEEYFDDSFVYFLNIWGIWNILAKNIWGIWNILTKNIWGIWNLYVSLRSKSASYEKKNF